MLKITKLDMFGEEEQIFKKIDLMEMLQICGNIKCGSAVIISDPSHSGILRCGVGVAAEADGAGLDLLKKRGVPALTCGFSPTCSVTISGKSENDTVICFQREVRMNDDILIEAGERVLPAEFGRDDLALMFFAAVGALIFGESFFDSFV